MSRLMSSDVGSMAIVLALVLALAAVFAPVAMTEEGVGCVENDVQIDGQALQLQSDGCAAEEQLIAASGVCVESEVRIDGQAIHLRSGACSRESAEVAEGQSPPPQAVAQLNQPVETPSAPLHHRKPAAQRPVCRTYHPRLFPPV